MTEISEDLGVLMALGKRLTEQRLPKALVLKEKVDQGGRLDEYDIAFLEEVFADAQRITPIIERNPEFQDIAARVITLYKEITDQALKNEESQ